jgi:hypothetical protein
VSKVGTATASAPPHLEVIGLRRTESEVIVTELLTLVPKSKFIVVSHDARNMTGYELRLRKLRLSNLSPDAFIDFIRADDEEIGV